MITQWKIRTYFSIEREILSNWHKLAQHFASFIFDCVRERKITCVQYCFDTSYLVWKSKIPEHETKACLMTRAFDMNRSVEMLWIFVLNISTEIPIIKCRIYRIYIQVCMNSMSNYHLMCNFITTRSFLIYCFYGSPETYFWYILSFS